MKSILPVLSLSIDTDHKNDLVTTTDTLLSSASNSSTSLNIESISEVIPEITNFSKLNAITNESTHAYSYNPLSLNSLTIRLNILKRTLEILIKNPDLLREPHISHNRNLLSLPTHNHRRTPTEIFNGDNKISALNTFVSKNISSVENNTPHIVIPHLQRRSISSMSSFEKPHTIYKNNDASKSSELIQEQKSELSSLLKFLNETLEKNTSSKATDLHQLSLLNINKLFNSPDDDQMTTLHMKKIFLDSLAEPFIEQIQETTSQNLEIEDKIRSVINNFTAAKNSHSLAIFTCEPDYPWSVRSANDLTCLYFGVSKKTIKVLTLLDLIHLDSRAFLISRLTHLDIKENDMVMTGEIIPTMTNGNLSWNSLWIRKKNDMLVCVLENVPCDYMDLLLDFNSNFNIKKILLNNNNRNLVIESSSSEMSAIENISQDNQTSTEYFSKSLHKIILDVISQSRKDSNIEPLANKISDNINSKRYFTLNHLSSNIPCAISSSVLNHTLKLKVHSLPYQSGLFILNLDLKSSPSAFDYKLISFNKSISKNLFGFNYKELIDQSITKIIPSFNKLIKYIQKTSPDLNIQSSQNNGLLLTEHFFRKVQANMLHNPDEFYTSIGINGIHKDGSPIKVDIQLRVINPHVVLVWLTYSREVIFNDYNTIPSQLNLVESEQEENFSQFIKELSLDTPSPTTTKTENVEPGNNQSHDKTIYEHGSINIATTTNHLKIELNENDLLLEQKVEDAKKNCVTDKSVFVRSESFKIDSDNIKRLASSQEVPSIKVIGENRRVTKFSDFTIVQKLGEGAYGKVHLCVHNLTRKLVIIKSIFKERILVDTWVRDRQLGTIPSEINIMSKFNSEPHENILKILGFFEDDNYYYIEIERHGGDVGCIDLFDFIEFKDNMTESECKLIFRQIASSIKHMHERGIVHRDIKDENIIVDSDGFVKLIDFGSAAYVKSGPFDVFVGTIDYAAPEVLNGNPYSGKPQDIWAIGVLLYTLIFKENPFYNVDEILDSDIKITSDKNISQDCIDLIKVILKKDMKERPTIDDIVNAKWLKD